MRSYGVSMRKNFENQRGEEGRRQKTFEGKFAEMRLLGECEKLYEGKFLPQDLAIEEVKKNQPKELPRFANEIQDAVDMLLYPDEEDGTENVRFFTAINSTLDIKHGTDGFFEIHDPVSGKTHRITIDITMNPQKTLSKADIIIRIPEEGINISNDPRLFRETVTEAAKKIVTKLNAIKEKNISPTQKAIDRINTYKKHNKEGGNNSENTRTVYFKKF